jgi:hypothetical protein
MISLSEDEPVSDPEDDEEAEIMAAGSDANSIEGFIDDNEMEADSDIVSDYDTDDSSPTYDYREDLKDPSKAIVETGEPLVSEV